MPCFKKPFQSRLFFDQTNMILYRKRKTAFDWANSSLQSTWAFSQFWRLAKQADEFADT